MSAITVILIVKEGSQRLPSFLHRRITLQLSALTIFKEKRPTMTLQSQTDRNENKVNSSFNIYFLIYFNLGQ